MHRVWDRPAFVTDPALAGLDGVSQASPIRSLSSCAERAPLATHDAAFGAVLGDAARLARVLSIDAHEGPVYLADEDTLYFTTLPRRLNQAPAPGYPKVEVKRIALDGERFPLGPDSVSTVREDANVANGMALDLEGRLLACEQATPSQHAAMTRTYGRSGAVETLVDEYAGLRLNRRYACAFSSDIPAMAPGAPTQRSAQRLAPSGSRSA